MAGVASTSGCCGVHQCIARSDMDDRLSCIVFGDPLRYPLSLCLCREKFCVDRQKRAVFVNVTDSMPFCDVM